MLLFLDVVFKFPLKFSQLGKTQFPPRKYMQAPQCVHWYVTAYGSNYEGHAC